MITQAGPSPPDHFLAPPRPDALLGVLPGVADAITLAAYDFDVDNPTGFMPSQAPLRRLPHNWEAWELILDDAMNSKLQLGAKPDLPAEGALKSALWRSRVREIPVLPTVELYRSELLLQRAHLVLVSIMHFYVHTLPPGKPVTIPPSITLPLLRVCLQLQLPPVLTYSDNVLYKWSLKTPSSEPTPALDNLQCNTLFTGTNDEQEFILTSARMELRGAEALGLMKETIDEFFMGGDIAISRAINYLDKLALVINDLKSLLLSIRDGCDPEVFYNDIRPWLNGTDAEKREWIFEGLDQDPTLTYPTELSGTTAGQSSLIHALDIFLGVNRYSHSSSTTDLAETAKVSAKEAFLNRMQLYMPHHHRNFLRHLSANPRPLRDIVEASADIKFVNAYNAAVQSLKELRDAHLIVVTLYVVGPARRKVRLTDPSAESAPLVGTGGTELMKFLKGIRDGTRGVLIIDRAVTIGV